MRIVNLLLTISLVFSAYVSAEYAPYTPYVPMLKNNPDASAEHSVKALRKLKEKAMIKIRTIKPIDNVDVHKISGAISSAFRSIENGTKADKSLKGMFDLAKKEYLKKKGVAETEKN